MHIPEPLQFTIARFSAQRVGYALAMTSFAFVPGHSYVACEVSVLINGFGLLLFFLIGVFSFFIPSGTPHRLRPLAWGFIAFVTHCMFTH